MRYSWRVIGARVLFALWFFIAVGVLCIPLFLALGCGNSSPATEKPVAVMSAEGEREARAVAERKAAEAEKAAAVAKSQAIDARLDQAAAELKAQKAENDLKLGVQAGRKTIIQAADGVGIFGAVVAVILALTLLRIVFGGPVSRWARSRWGSPSRPVASSPGSSSWSTATRSPRQSAGRSSSGSPC
jgi:hypothetical protein